MKGNIFHELIVPATRGRRTNGKKRGLVTLDMMRRNIEKIASVTRKDDPFKTETRVGNVIRRSRTV